MVSGGRNQDDFVQSDPPHKGGCERVGSDQPEPGEGRTSTGW
jgi:hypothetical protein